MALFTTFAASIIAVAVGVHWLALFFCFVIVGVLPLWLCGAVLLLGLSVPHMYDAFVLFFCLASFLVRLARACG